MFLRSVGAIALLMLASMNAKAADVANQRGVTIIVPFAANGPTDILGRALAHSLEKTLKRQVLVKNVEGAGGTIGAERVAKAKADGATLLLSNMGHATSVPLYPYLRYDAVKDFEPVGLVAEVPMTLIAKPALKVDSVGALAAYARETGGGLAIGHAGVGSASYLCGTLLMDAFKVQAASVFYRGTALAIRDLINGHIDLLCDQTTHTLPHIKDSTVKALGISGKDRLPALREVPTLAEAGVPGLEFTVWHGLYVPKGTPKEKIGELVNGLQESLRSDALKAAFAGHGAVPASPDEARPEALRARLADEIKRWSGVLGQVRAVAE